MRLPEGLLLIAAKIRKHGTVAHVMPVDHDIVRNAQCAVFLHIGNTVVAVRAIKGPLQIIVGFLRGLHDGVIDVGTLNAEPANKVIVLFIHSRILFVCADLHRNRLRRFRYIVAAGGFHLRSRGGQCFHLDQLGNTVKNCRALPLILIVLPEHCTGEQKNSGKYCRQGDQNIAFHNISSIQLLLLAASLPKIPSPGLVVIS